MDLENNTVQPVASDDFGIDLDNLNPGARFPWPHGKEGSGEYVEFRVAADEDFRQFRKKIGADSGKPKVDYQLNPETRRMERIEYAQLTKEQQEQLDDEVNDFSVTGWRLLDKKGREIPCTRGNKIKLWRGMPKFQAFGIKCLKRLREDAAEAAKAELGN